MLNFPHIVIYILLFFIETYLETSGKYKYIQFKTVKMESQCDIGFDVLAITELV